jgi:hypothetical protein
MLNDPEQTEITISSEQGETPRSKEKSELNEVTKLAGYIPSSDKIRDAIEFFDKELRFQIGANESSMHMRTLGGTSQIAKMSTNTPDYSQNNSFASVGAYTEKLAQKKASNIYLKEVANNNIDQFLKRLDVRLDEWGTKQDLDHAQPLYSHTNKLGDKQGAMGANL